MKDLKIISSYLGVEQRELELNINIYNSPKNLEEAKNMYNILCSTKNNHFLERLINDWNRLCFFMLNKSKNIKDLKSAFEKTPDFLPVSRQIAEKWKERSEKDLSMPHNLRSLKYMYENTYFTENDFELKSKIIAMYIDETEHLLENAITMKDLKYIFMYGEKNIRKKAFSKIREVIDKKALAS